MALTPVTRLSKRARKYNMIAFSSLHYQSLSLVLEQISSKHPTQARRDTGPLAMDYPLIARADKNKPT
jgi:hypothetical protein